MTAFLLTLLRHGFVVLAAYLATHGIADATTTQGLVMGVCLAGVVAFASWIGKMMKFDEAFGKDPSFIEGLRTALGAVISQGITFASSYYAINANDPAALGVALINAVASHYGVQQQIAHATPIKVAAAIKALAVCGSVLLLSSCGSMMAFLASPAGQATVSLAELGLDVAAGLGKVKQGQVVTIKQAVAVVTDPNDSKVNKTFKLAELGLKEAVASGLIKPGDALLIQEGVAIVQTSATAAPEPSAKAPVKVLPTTAHVMPKDRRELPSHYAAMKQSGVSVPLYGQRVAFMLSTAAIGN